MHCRQRKAFNSPEAAWALTVILAGLHVPACRGREAATDAAVHVTVSPLANPDPAAPGLRSTQDAALRAGRVADESRAIVERRAGLGDARGKREEEPGSDALGDDSERAERAEMEARQRTEAAVDGAIKRAFALFQRCYQTHQGGSTPAVLKFRLHRSGYVVNPEVTTGKDRLDACLRGVLSEVRVTGVETESLTIERTIQGVVR